LRNLELFEERQIFEHARRMSAPFQARLKALAEHPLVGEARGVGMIGAVELVANKETKALHQGAAAYCAGRGEANGLIVRNIGETIACCPPLIISEDQIHELFDKLERALDETLEWVRRG
jgi:4-aminobutyrate--pyruvate transaminase